MAKKRFDPIVHVGGAGRQTLRESLARRAIQLLCQKDPTPEFDEIRRRLEALAVDKPKLVVVDGGRSEHTDGADEP